MFINDIIKKIKDKKQYYKDIIEDNEKKDKAITEARQEISFLKSITSGNRCTQTANEVLRVTSRKLEDIEEILERGI